MVGRADPQHDYYKDLDCTPSASQDDLKKAFKKMALKYHPDRNHGNELVANAKFLEIQAAHEILMDPEKRAKYDADRIRATLFASRNTAATAPDIPPRSPFATNFPPPPRRTQPPPPPPPPQSRTKPQPTAQNAAGGANRYAQFTTDRNGNPWKTTANEQQAKANAFKTWQQMNHGQKPAPTRPVFSGPPPPRRTARGAQAQPQDGAKPSAKARGGWDEDMPPPPRAAPYDANNAAPNGAPGVGRSQTTKSPRRPPVFPPPWTGDGNEPQAKHSAYATVSGGARPQATRPQSYYPPPPAGPPPTSRPEMPAYSRPEPKDWLPKSSNGDSAVYGERISTPYAATGGEKTNVAGDDNSYFTSGHMNRSASTASNLHRKWPQPPSASASRSPQGHTRHRSASPHIRRPQPPGAYSSTSSSSSGSSSDDEDDTPRERVKLTPKSKTRGPSKGIPVGYARRASLDHRPTHTTNAEASHSSYPNVTIEVDDGPDPMAGPLKQRATWSPELNGNFKGQAKQYPASQPSSRKGSAGNAEGFMKHRLNHSTGQGSMPGSPLSSKPAWTADGMSKPLEKSRSWQEKFGSVKDGNNRFERPDTGDDHKPNQPGYDRDSFSPPKFSSAFNFPPPLTSIESLSQYPSYDERVRKGSWPYWAIPSSIMPNGHDVSPSGIGKEDPWPHVGSPVPQSADRVQSNSFYIPTDSSSSASPLRPSSTENVNTQFSPADWHVRFSGEDASDYLGPQPGEARNAPRGRSPQKRPTAQNAFHKSQSGDVAQSATEQMPPPPRKPVPAPQPSPATFSQVDWARHFQESTWAYPSASPTNPASSSRWAKTPRKNSSAANKRPVIPKTATVSNAVDEELAQSGTASEGDSAMDIDIDSQNTPPQTEPIAPREHKGPVSKANPHATPSSPSDHSINLNGLKDTGPLAPSASGLSDLGDLATTLPFESQPSHNLPGPHPTPQRLSLPEIPTLKVPFDKDSLTQGRWEQYQAHLRTYLQQWNAYNGRMLAHFWARQEQACNLPEDLLRKSGEEASGAWKRGIDEDVRVRAHWDLSWEMHKQVVEQMEEFRAKAWMEGLGEQ